MPTVSHQPAQRTGENTRTFVLPRVKVGHSVTDINCRVATVSITPEA